MREIDPTGVNIVALNNKILVIVSTVDDWGSLGFTSRHKHESGGSELNQPSKNHFNSSMI
jgi:hypothetical protein